MILVLVAALITDQFLGEVKRFHPLVGFGKCAMWVENWLNRKNHGSIFIGLMGVVILVLPAALVVFFLSAFLHKLVGFYTFVLDILIVYWALGLRSLTEHVEAIKKALLSQNIIAARQLLSLVVSRDSHSLNQQQISSAAIETTLENGCDAVFAVLFWYCVGGCGGVVAYRLINTLDAMWGYRTERYECFGKVAAKLDDVLNYLPARLTALSYGVLGNFKGAIKSCYESAHLLASPNAGLVMAAGAGSLNVRLGGGALYRGKEISKPYFGGSDMPSTESIASAVKMVILTTLLWCFAIGFTQIILRSI